MRSLGLLRTGRNKRRNGSVQGLENSTEWDTWEAAQKWSQRGKTGLGKKRGCRIDKGRKKGRSLYIPMHQRGFKEHFSCLMQKRTASNQSPTPLKPVLGSSLEFLRFPGSHKGLGEYLATPLQPARPLTEPLK